MITLDGAVDHVIAAQTASGKPFAVVLAGHNGSGKSTMWHLRLAGTFQIPLINADRMMMSILPEPGADGHLVPWARALRDSDRGWMSVAQQGVQAFVGRAMVNRVPFAMETVFSHWQELEDGHVASKIDVITEMQDAGYFVLLFFVGLANAQISMARVQTRVGRGGHGVEEATLRRRFPRTQLAISKAAEVADATISVDNSRDESNAFALCRVQFKNRMVFDIREGGTPPLAIKAWMTRVYPRDDDSSLK